MVSTAYMTEHKPRPTALRRFFDQDVTLAAADLAGGMEAVLERVGLAARRRPAVVLGTALLTGAMLFHVLLGAVQGARGRR